MLRDHVEQELRKCDILGTLHNFTIFAKEYLELGKKQPCLIELNKLQDYIEGLQEITTILNILETTEVGNNNQIAIKQNIDYQIDTTKIYN